MRQEREAKQSKRLSSSTAVLNQAWSRKLVGMCTIWFNFTQSLLHALKHTRTGARARTHTHTHTYSVFMCFVWISEQTAIISLYNIN